MTSQPSTAGAHQALLWKYSNCDLEAWCSVHEGGCVEMQMTYLGCLAHGKCWCLVAGDADTTTITTTTSSSSNSSVDPCACSTPLHLPDKVPLSSSSSSSDRPQLLVCHDMRGGYLDYEAYLAGSVDANEYRIWHWDCIDIFVYFRSVGQLLGCWLVFGGGAHPRWVGNWGAGVVAHVPDCCLDYEARIAGSVDADDYRIWHWDCRAGFGG